jgi:hypothetical protein
LADLTAELIRANRILFYARNRNLIAEDTLMRTAGVGKENGNHKWPMLLLILSARRQNHDMN